MADTGFKDRRFIDQWNDSNRELENARAGGFVNEQTGELSQDLAFTPWGMGLYASYTGYNSPEERKKRELEWMKQNQMQGAINQAKDFQQSIPGLEQGLYSQIEGDAKRSLADSRRNIKREASRRGLLYSNMRTGDEARAASEIASQAAQKKSGVSKELQAIDEDFQRQAAEMAQKNYANDLQISQDVYNLALDSAKQRAANLNAGIGAIGTVAGAYFGSKK